MAVPTRKQVLKRERMKSLYEKKETKAKEKAEEVTEEEHEKRIKMLKDIGLLK